MSIVQFSKDMFNKYKQFIMFCIVGVINTLVSFIVYTVLNNYINYQIANAISDVAGGINSYFWNRFWVFKESKAKTNESVPKFTITFLIYMLASWLLIKLCVDKIGIEENLAKLVVLPITTILNYIMNKIWTFKRKIK